MPLPHPLAPKRLAALAFAPALLAATPARADVGPIDESCTAERRCVEGGVECRYVNSDPELGDLACEEKVKKEGLEFVCSRGGGTVGSHIYCPKGQVKKAGCTVAPDAGATGLAGLAGLASLLLVVRAARRRRSSP